MKFRVPGAALVVVLVAASCTVDGFGAGEVKPGAKACLEEVRGAGDLKVTDSAFTVLDPKEGSDKYRVTYAVKVTNRSKTDTAMAAGIGVSFVNEDGDLVRQVQEGHVEYVPPGESRFVAGAMVEGFDEPPADMNIELPYPISEVHPKWKSTFWWPHKKVNYPHEIKVNDVTLSENSSVAFDVYNSSEKTFDTVELVTILRDEDGKLLGGQHNGPMSDDAPMVLEIEPGEDEVREDTRLDFPSEVDRSKTEVQLSNSPNWTKLGETCLFTFDPRV